MRSYKVRYKVYYLVSSNHWHQNVANKRYSIKASTLQELKEKIPAYLKGLFKRNPGFKDKILPGLEIVAYENFDYYLTLPLKKKDYRNPEARTEEFNGITFHRQSRIDKVLAGLIYCVIRGFDDTFKRICTFNWPFAFDRFVNRKFKDECFWGDLDRKERKKIIAECRTAAHNITLDNNILNPISE